MKCREKGTDVLQEVPLVEASEVVSGEAEEVEEEVVEGDADALIQDGALDKLHTHLTQHTSATGNETHSYHMISFNDTSCRKYLLN